MEQFLEGNWPIIIVLSLWSLVWKGLALWKAARLGQKNWFIAILVINLAGLLEILYIYVFSKKQPTAQQISNQK